MLNVVAGRLRGDDQFLRDLPDRPSLHGQPQDLDLSIGQPCRVLTPLRGTADVAGSLQHPVCCALVEQPCLDHRSQLDSRLRRR